MRLGSLESHEPVTSDRMLSDAGMRRFRHGVCVPLPGPRQSLNLQFIKRRDHVSVGVKNSRPTTIGRANSASRNFNY
jgi:hypothetical protein